MMIYCLPALYNGSETSCLLVRVALVHTRMDIQWKMMVEILISLGESPVCPHENYSYGIKFPSTRHFPAKMAIFRARYL